MQNTLRIDKITRNTLLSVEWRSFYNNVKSYFNAQIVLQKSNLFLWIPIIFACGIGTYFSLPFEPPLFLAIFSLVLAVALYSMAGKFRFFALALLIYIAGFFAATYRSYSITAPILSKKISTTEITGYIFQLEKLDKWQGSRIILDVLEIEKLSADKTPLRVRLTIRKDKNIHLGQKVRLLAGLNPPSEPLIPGGFDFRRHLYFQKIGAVGFVYNEPEALVDNDISKFSFTASWNNIIESLRRNIELRIYNVLPANSAAIASALLVGKKNAIADDDQQAMRDGGLAHMLAISGLHVGIFSGTLFFIIRFMMACIPALALRYQIKKIAAVIAIIGAVFYMLIAGSTIPTQRSVLMITIIFLAIIIDRSPISLRLVAASALVVLALRPDSLLSVSFQMSFAAVACLIYFYDITRQFWVNLYTQTTLLKKAALYFLGVCITTIIASIATAPFALYHFGQVSFIGSVANLVAVPLFGFFIMPFALISLLLMPFRLDAIPLSLMGYGIEGILDVSYWAASLPYAVVHNTMWPFSAFILINASVLFIMLWKGAGKITATPFLIFGLFLTQSTVMPDILISGSHKLFIFKNPSSSDEAPLLTSSRRNDRFVLKNWEKLYGLPEKSAQLLDYKGTGKKGDTGLYQCGEQGCRFTIKGNKVSFARSAYILKEECAWADLVVSVEPIPYKLQCQAQYKIDKFDTWEKGTHAVWFTKSGVSNSEIEIRTIAQSQGNRPWARFNGKSVKD
jgi:competence protein ComEC